MGLVTRDAGGINSGQRNAPALKGRGPIFMPANSTHHHATVSRQHRGHRRLVRNPIGPSGGLAPKLPQRAQVASPQGAHPARRQQGGVAEGPRGPIEDAGGPRSQLATGQGVQGEASHDGGRSTPAHPGRSGSQLRGENVICFLGCSLCN